MHFSLPGWEDCTGYTSMDADPFYEIEVSAPQVHTGTAEETSAEDVTHFWRGDCHGQFSICLPVHCLNTVHAGVRQAMPCCSMSRLCSIGAYDMQVAYGNQQYA